MLCHARFRDGLQFMRRNRLCDNCAKKGHVANYCFSKSSCNVVGCKQKHHFLLHRARLSGSSAALNSSSDFSTAAFTNVTSSQQSFKQKPSTIHSGGVMTVVHSSNV